MLVAAVLFAVSLMGQIVPPNPCSGAVGSCNPCLEWRANDLTQTQCVKCHPGYYLAFLSDDRVLCAKQRNTQLDCKLDEFYTQTQEQRVVDPGDLQLYTLTDGRQVCYGKFLAFKIMVASGLGCSLGGSAFKNCKKCGDQTYLAGLNTAAESYALKSSIGCAVCEANFLPVVEPHKVFAAGATPVYRRDCVARQDITPQQGQLCSWSKVWKYRSSNSAEPNKLECVECSLAVPGCKWCSSVSTCLECESEAFGVTSLATTGLKLTCFYDFCGFNGKGVSQMTGKPKACQCKLSSILILGPCFKRRGDLMRMSFS